MKTSSSTAKSLLSVLQAVLGRDHARLELKWMRDSQNSSSPGLEEMVRRRVSGEPLQYILGGSRSMMSHIAPKRLICLRKSTFWPADSHHPTTGPHSSSGNGVLDNEACPVHFPNVTDPAICPRSLHWLGLHTLASLSHLAKRKCKNIWHRHLVPGNPTR